MRSVALACLMAIVGCGGPSTTVTPAELSERWVAPAIVVAANGVAHVRAPFIGWLSSREVAEAAEVERGDTLGEVDGEDRLMPDVLLAPIDGVVLAANASAGDDVGPWDRALFEIADPTHVELRLELEDAAAMRAEGAHVRVVTQGGQASIAETTIERIAGRMEARQLGATGEGASRIRAAWAPLPASGEPIGRELEAIVELAPVHVDACVPQTAILVRDGHAWVRVPGLVFDRELEVQLGRSDGVRVEITGVAPGTVVRTNATP